MKSEETKAQRILAELRRCQEKAGLPGYVDVVEIALLVEMDYHECLKVLNYLRRRGKVWEYREFCIPYTLEEETDVQGK